jgi:Mrp family chromosome partitioning ATPase
MEIRDTVAPLPVTRRRQVNLSPTSLAAHGISVPSNGFSRSVEEFRALKRNVISNAMRAGNAQNRIVLITSSRPGEGKTFTAISLALSLAYEKDTRVLLVDADAYRQSLMNYLGISSDTGWLDVVSDNGKSLGETIFGTNVPGLSVLPSGMQRSEIPELMSSRHMSKLVADLVQEDPGRFIIMDALPCLTSTEPSILAGLAGQTLFVVAASQTSREDVETALRQLNASPSVNLVLNKVEPLLSEQFKGYGYAYQR